MAERRTLPFPKLDALPLGAHRLSALTDEELFAQVGVRIAFSGREGGVSESPFASLNTGGHVGDDPAAVAENRRILQEAAGFAGVPVVCPNQVHGTQVVVVESPDTARRSQELADAGADALVVACAGVGALLNFADCLPVIIVSPTGRFAVAHAGWRGAVAGIAGKAVRELARVDRELQEPSEPAGYNAYIGPHIRVECFEVGPEVSAQFVDAFGSAVVPGGRHVSLAASVSADLQAAGLLPERICDSGICTKCSSGRYFSYRATNGACGRQAAFACR